MSVESEVAAHYSRAGLEETILDTLKKSGKDIDRLATADLSAADEFHLGWRAATVAFAADLAFPKGARLLDIGSGIGGPARYFAEAGADVTGIDITPDFVEAANGLTKRVGLAGRATFRVASALDLPFEAARFDGAYTIHVAMNIADKAKLFAETRRVLKPGARFGVYDVMRVTADALPYPMPWAATAATSFVETPATYRQLLSAAGFTIESEKDRSAEVREIARQMREKAAKEGPPILSLSTLRGGGWPEGFANVFATLEKGAIAPWQIIARAV